MKLVHQRTLDKVVGAAVCRFLSLFPWSYRQVPSGFRPRKIVVIILSEMGTLVLAKPMFDLLKERYPGAAFHLLVFERNSPALEILNHVPKENVLTINDRSLRSFVSSSLRVLARLRRTGIDTVIDCELFSRISSLFSLLSGAKVRAGFEPHTQDGLYRGGFINRPVLYNPYTHISLQLMHMVDSLECKGAPLVKNNRKMPCPDFDTSLLDPEEKHRFIERLERDFPVLRNARLVLIYPGGGLLPIRAWPLSHYHELVKGLVERRSAVGVIGTGEDRHLAQEIRKLCPEEKCLDFTGYTRTVKELVFLLQRSVLLIGNDGGPAHFASISSTPTIVFYGPETPMLYGTLGKACLLYAPLPCSPCLTAYNHRNSPCDGDNQCLKRISPESVLKKVDEMIGGPGAAGMIVPGIFNPLDPRI